MKIAAVLVVLSVYYIASIEQAAAISGVHRYSPNTQSSKEQAAGYPGVYEYPSKQLKEIQYRLQQAMGDFETSAKALTHDQRAKAQYDVPTDPQELYKCAHQDCGSEESCFVMYGRDMIVSNNCVCVCVFISSCLATKAFIGNLPATRMMLCVCVCVCVLVVVA